MYIHLSLSQGEFYFADEAFRDIEMFNLMPPTEFEKYKVIYAEKRQHAIDNLNNEDW